MGTNHEVVRTAHRILSPDGHAWYNGNGSVSAIGGAASLGGTLMDATSALNRPLKLALLVLALVVFAAGAAAAVPLFWTASTASDANVEWVDVGWGSEPYELRVTDSDLESTRLGFELSRFMTASVTAMSGEWTAVALPGAALRLELGSPELPVVRASIALSDLGGVELHLSDAVYDEFAGVDLLPSKGSISRDVDPAGVPYEFGPVYEVDRWYPEETAELGKPYIFRDTRGAVVSVNAFQYNPIRRTLRVLRSATIEVVATGARGSSELVSRPCVRSSEFERIYTRHYVNADALFESGVLATARGRYTPIPEVGPMLVIAYDDFVSSMAPFVEWKEQAGVPTSVVALSTIGTTDDDIRSYILNAYDTDGIAFVLLVGDADQIPTYLDGTKAADPMYTLLDGGDSYPEILIGRFSAETVDQVVTHVTRSIEYERDPQAGAEWYGKSCGIASDQDGGTGTPDKSFMEDMRQTLLGFTFTEVDALYDPGVTDVMIAAAVNEGRSLVNYMGHGNTMGWSTGTFISGDVDALVNDDMLPWIVSTACYVGKFHTTRCFAEVWMRATNGDRPSGAVGIYASSISQDWVPPIVAHLEIMDLLVTEENYTLAGLMMNGACAMIDAHGSVGANEFTHWHVFGDPSLRVRTATPDTLVVTHAGSVDPEDFEFTVQTMAGALASLSDGGECIGAAFADGGGEAVIAFADTLTGDSVMLTVTGFNRFPYTEQVPLGNGSSSGDTTSVLSLSQNFPNPTRRGTAIAFTLPAGGDVKLAVYDVAGRHVATLVDGYRSADSYQVAWEGKDDAGNNLATGVYFYRLETPQGEKHRKMLLLR